MTTVTVTACPPPERLKALLDQQLTETETCEIVAHLDACENCSQKLEEIAGGGDKVRQLVKHCDKEKPDTTSAYWPALEQIEQEFKRSTSDRTALVRTKPGQEISPVDTRQEISFDFLDPPEQPDSLGTLDRFQILNVIGRGGMGVVFRALDACLERIVAIKMLDPQYAKNELAHDRFCREARSAAKIMHENVVTIHHVDENEKKELPYIVMQYVKGQSLQDRLDNKKAMELYDIVRIGKQIASGLAAAHSENLIHRDVKPANILIEERTNRVLLTDFGLARMSEDVKLTQTGFVAGTPLFMSPEQARGEAVDYRSDLFSLGSVLYAMCTGSPPFIGSTPFLVLRSVTELSPKPIQELNPTVPDWLAEVIERLLAKDPKSRYQSAAEVADILEQELVSIPRRSYKTSVRTRTPLLPKITRGVSGRRLSYIGLASLLLTAGLLTTEATRLTHFTVLGQRNLSSAKLGSGEVDDAPQKPKQLLPVKSGPVWGIAYSHDGKMLATGSEDGAIRFWNAKTGEANFTINNAHNGPIWALAFNNDGTEIYSCSDDGLLKLWRLSDQRYTKFMPVESGIRSIAVSKSGQYVATGARNGVVSIHDIRQGVTLASLASHDGPVMAMAFSPNDEILASGSIDKTVKLWQVNPKNTRNALVPKNILKHETSIYTLAFSPDGKLLATAGWDSEIRIWSMAKDNMIKQFEAHRSEIFGLKFNPLNSELISVGSDRMVKFWEAESGTLKHAFRAHDGPITNITFAPDGKTFATSSRDGTVQEWDTPR
ncbi:protein kinase [Telmatocola sphagniphila]|uniref:non-specific serine/threonine protein kinase n=1 Tax=Telmatocola sphagniphila TaxID=1123043 RepID=A0A8E6B475_9BACT|nr:serine/threonine-protein kinase [Telmatocola sphagniphila]QVL31411.1 protein kinase [Telmatocola sphagniphila]